MKPTQKKPGARIRKYGSHFTKYLYERDTIFATVWVFLLILIVTLNPINFYFLNPLKQALKDFDFNDLTYSQLKKGSESTLDSQVVLVNIGHANREELSFIIDQVAEAKPRVIGLDALFEAASDPHPDSLLSATFRKHRNLVAAVRIDWHESDSFYISKNYFLRDAVKYGYVNFPHEDFETIRYVAPFKKDNHAFYPSFSAAIIQLYNPVAYDHWIRRNKELETINYTRRVNQYSIIEPSDLLAGNVEESIIKDKIVLMGYIQNDPNDIEDKKFTPMNPRSVGKSFPDMNGIVVHANIISMVLGNNYIKKLPSWVNVLVAILIGWLHMSFFIRYYLEDHIWFHLVAKIAQLISAIIFAGLGIILFDLINIKLDMKLSIVVIVIAVDVIYFYEAFAVWMHKKYNYRTVFHQKHH